jgi:sulfite exporter TauE/SafE
MEILSGFVVGMLGSLHCVGMCGPLALALPVPSGPAGMFFLGRMLYNGGRAVTYALLGAAAGSVGRFIVLAGWQQGLSIVTGGVLLLSVVVPATSAAVSSRFTLPGRVAGALREHLVRLFRRRSVIVLFAIGILNGLLPCGFVYIGLAAAAATGTVLSAAMFMAGFGLGTMPVMLGVSLAGRHIGPVFRRRVSVLTPVVTVALALFIILRGMNLGIPYVSPVLPHQQVGADSSCCH